MRTIAAGTVDKLNVRIGANIAPFQNAIRRISSQLQRIQGTTSKTATSMRSSFDGITNSVKKIGAAIGSVAAARKLIEFGKQAIEAGSDLAEVQNVVDTVFGNMTKDINDWSKSAMTSFGLSETAAKRYTSTIGAMLKSSGIAGNNLKTMSVNMAALAADMASFYNLSSEAAFEKIRAGISGETEPLKQLGINMSVANMEAYALSQGITKSYNAMSQSEQMILRYNYLLSVTADAQHDFERTSKSWANQVRVLSEQFERLKTIIGQGLIQALTPLLQLLNKLLERVVLFAQAVAKAFGVTSESNNAQTSMSDLANSADDTAEGLEAADKAAKKLNNTIGGFDELHILGDESAADTAADKLSNLNIASLDVYGSAAKGIDKLSSQIDDFVSKLGSKLEPVKQLAEDIKQSFIDAFSGDIGNQLIENLKQGFWSIVDIIAAIADGFDKAWNKNDAGTALFTAIGTAANTVLSLVNDIGISIVEAFSSDAGARFFDSLIARWTSFWNMINSIAGALQAAWNDGGAGTAYIESILALWASLNGVITAVENTIAQIFSNETGQEYFSALIELGTNLNDIISRISDTFVKVWENTGIGQSIIEGIIGTITNLLGFVNDLSSHFLEAWESASAGETMMNSVLGAVNSIIAIVQELSAAWRAAWDNDVTTQIFSGLMTIITNIADTVKNVANNIREAFSFNGIDISIFQQVQNAIAGIVDIASQVSSALKNAFSNIDWSPIAQAAATLAEAISNVVQAAAGLAGGIIAQFGADLAEAFSSAMPGIIRAVAAALEVVSKILGAIDPQGVVGLATAFMGLRVIYSVVSMFSSVTQAISGFTGISSGAVGVILLVTTAVTGLVVALTALVDAWNEASSSASSATQSLSSASTAMQNSSGGGYSIASYTGISTADIPALATGGALKAGQLFIANEQTGNPELVGQQNGRSIVMNNEQIVDAVSNGVATALQPLVDSMQSGGGEQTVKIRGNDLIYTLSRTQKQRGAAISSNFGFGGA